MPRSCGESVFNFYKNCQTVSIVSVRFTSPPAVHEVPVPPHPPLARSGFLVSAIFMGKW